MTKLPEEVFISIDGKEGFVKTYQYVTGKLKSLKDFGYSDLTRETIEKELLKVLNHQSKDLTVIGMFIEEDIKALPVD